jgi:hypothetical protein
MFAIEGDQVARSQIEQAYGVPEADLKPTSTGFHGSNGVFVYDSDDGRLLSSMSMPLKAFCFTPFGNGPPAQRWKDQTATSNSCHHYSGTRQTRRAWRSSTSSAPQMKASAAWEIRTHKRVELVHLAQGWRWPSHFQRR